MTPLSALEQLSSQRRSWDLTFKTLYSFICVTLSACAFATLLDMYFVYDHVRRESDLELHISATIITSGTYDMHDFNSNSRNDSVWCMKYVHC